MTTVLQFGGGKDSLAVLHLMRPQWDRLTVCWLNTGAAFPETEAQMAEIAAQVPNFLEVRTDVQADIAERGWPVDVVPVSHTALGQAATGEKPIKLRSWLDCCAANFWLPLHQKMVEIGATRIIRGQRTAEHYKSPARHGEIHDGIEYLFPIQDWSEQDVFDFLARIGVEVPEHYQETQSSLDCWNCTAYLDAKLAQLGYLKRKHPDKHEIVVQKLKEIAAEVRAVSAPLMEAASHDV